MIVSSKHLPCIRFPAPTRMAYGRGTLSLGTPMTNKVRLHMFRKVWYANGIIALSSIVSFQGSGIY